MPFQLEKTSRAVVIQGTSRYATSVLQAYFVPPADAGQPSEAVPVAVYRDSEDTKRWQVAVPRTRPRFTLYVTETKGNKSTLHYFVLNLDQS